MSDDKTASTANDRIHPWTDPSMCETMFGPVPAPVAVWDGDERLTYANSAALALFNLALEDARGRDARSLLHPLPRAGHEAAAHARFLIAGLSSPAQSADGRQLLVLAAKLGEPSATNPWWVTSILETDASRERAGEVTPPPRLHDDLTGLPNRVLFIDRLEHVLRATQRDDSSSALCLVELDHIHDVKSALGDASVDRMLQAAGAGIAGTLRNIDTVARLGAERFAVLLPGASELGAVTAALRIREALDKPLELDGYSAFLSASIGIAMSPLHASDASALMAFADAALSAAKLDESKCVLYDAGVDAARDAPRP